MPVIKSAKKRVRQTKKAAVRNSKVRRSLRDALKTLQAAIEAKDSKKARVAFTKAQSTLDTAVKKNLIHENRAARKKKQLSAQVKAVSSVKKPASKKPPVTRAAPKAKKASSTKSAS